MSSLIEPIIRVPGTDGRGRCFAKDGQGAQMQHTTIDDKDKEEFGIICSRLLRICRLRKTFTTRVRRDAKVDRVEQDGKRGRVMFYRTLFFFFICLIWVYPPGDCSRLRLLRALRWFLRYCLIAFSQNVVLIDIQSFQRLVTESCFDAADDEICRFSH